MLLGVLTPYIITELKNEFGPNWWKEGILGILYEEQKRELPEDGQFEQLVNSLDIAKSLLIFDLHWQKIFRKKLSIDHRTWAKELSSFRNKLAHLGGEDFTDNDTWRALDTMSRLCEQLDPEGSEEIRRMLRSLKYGTEEGSTALKEISSNSNTSKQKTIGVLSVTPVSGLPNWRDVIEPHPDVAQGRYKNAEFAADLAQVARGEGTYEYRDPIEFFARTYITEGMSGLLEQSLRRICDKDGEPVIQLKTAFGGGKTHSMLALYHMMRGRTQLDKVPILKPILARAGISTLPKANVVVLVGTAIDPTKSKRPNNMPGITINTLWGELGAQIAESTGNLKLYDYVKEADKKGVSPGSETLKNLFDAAAPCLILIDELVAYAKKLYGANGLPAGTFDNLISFIQEITEAARASKNSMVVASIPESDIEIGGEAGKITLETIEHTFGRMESIWKPVAANEGFEIVRRRLFLDCKKPELRDLVCSNFSKMYLENQSDFPLETREIDYKERMIACYPIHPEVFDRLYGDWATLERFQRTRGVLRLMAAVIHELWMSNDAGLMIMPSSFPLDVPNVRDELTRHLSEGWNGLVDREVDGKSSIPYLKDQSNPRFGSKLVARRVARTIMIGSAPTSRDQNVRGIESSRIRLGVVQPGEVIAVFNDALSTLQNSLTYLYSNPSGDRFWYDTRPTLRKTVEDRATQMPLSEVEFEIEKRLREIKKEHPFSGVHVCPSSSLDIPDEQNVRLVILKPSDEYRGTNPDNRAITSINNILNNRGSNPRIYKNMLAFIAPDQELIVSLKHEVRRYLAWKSIKEDSIDLNLDASQNRETMNYLHRSNETVESRLKEAYCWLLYPYIDKKIDINTITWETIRISGGSDSIVSKAAKNMISNEAIICKWAPSLLHLELDNLLWKDSENIPIKRLWDYICTYCYLPRLASEDVVLESIKNGISMNEYFAFASAFDGSNYRNLKFNETLDSLEFSGLLVKTSVALKQIQEEKQKVTSNTSSSIEINEPITFDNEVNIPKDKKASNKYSSFYMNAQLDTTRVGRDVQKLTEEIISHLLKLEGCDVQITLELTAKSHDGFSVQNIRTISENCQVLKIKDFGFDE
ncbi:MAG: DUF499 domain-containing protein [Erysipelotrichaceae bacterium]